MELMTKPLSKLYFKQVFTQLETYVKHTKDSWSNGDVVLPNYLKRSQTNF